MDQHYRDIELVEIYDVINASRHDFEFYAKELPNPPAAILDVGCGTGSFAIDLAKRGYRVTGADPSPQMTQVARKKDCDRSVNWVTGLVTRLPPDPCFDAAIMTGHAFQCLLTDDEVTNLFRAVQERLKPGASFWFETRNPAVKPWECWTPQHSRPPIALDRDRTVRVVHTLLEVRDGFVTFEERYDFNDAEPLRSESTLRFLQVDEIADLVASCGLRVQETFGDWGKNPLTSDSPEIIVRLMKKAI